MAECADSLDISVKMAAECAAGCRGFMEDTEDECVGDEPVSCYNCRYRRWTLIGDKGYLCMKGLC
jgi:hypothetical protein